MHDIVTDKCNLIYESLSAIELYFHPIHTPEDFKKDVDGQLRLDDIVMRLQIIERMLRK